MGGSGLPTLLFQLRRMAALLKAIASIPLSKAVGVGLIGTAGLFASPALLPAVGFTAGGVAAGKEASYNSTWSDN